jgi:hypothetical protein
MIVLSRARAKLYREVREIEGWRFVSLTIYVASHLGNPESQGKLPAEIWIKKQDTARDGPSWLPRRQFGGIQLNR